MAHNEGATTKTKGRRKVVDPGKCDARAALASADAFRALATPFIRELGRQTLDEARQIPPQELGRLVATATSLALGVELYLKTLCIMTGTPVLQDHNLGDIYLQLPEDLRLDLESEYASIGPPPPGNVRQIRMLVGLVPDEPDPTSRESEADASTWTLADAFERSAHAFMTWRYIYEGAQADKPPITFSFHALEVAADVLRAKAIHFFGVIARRAVNSGLSGQA